jgi:GMP synthase-like glutamine amidotransferase
MYNILIIKNGYCDTYIDKIINQIVKANILIIKSFDKKINYIQESFIKKWDYIIILGGYQSVVDIDKYPYLYNIIKLIKIAISFDIKILGICLGCQLIAKAFDYNIIHMKNNEIGYHSTIKLTEEGLLDKVFSNCNNLDNILSFHTDMIDINSNKGLKVLGTYKKIPYIIKIKSAYGIQFHPEVNLCILKNYLKLKCDLLLSKKNIMDCIIKYAENNEKIILDNGLFVIKEWLLKN